MGAAMGAALLQTCANTHLTPNPPFASAPAPACTLQYVILKPAELVLAAPSLSPARGPATLATYTTHVPRVNSKKRRGCKRRSSGGGVPATKVRGGLRCTNDVAGWTAAQDKGACWPCMQALVLAMQAPVPGRQAVVRLLLLHASS
jgi:hypothetical protein